jgi:hypothetical protein
MNNGREGIQRDFSITLADTYGCSGSQILEVLSVLNEAEYDAMWRFGLTKGILEDWISSQNSLYN